MGCAVVRSQTSTPTASSQPRKSAVAPTPAPMTAAPTIAVQPESDRVSAATPAMPATRTTVNDTRLRIEADVQDEASCTPVEKPLACMLFDFRRAVRHAFGGALARGAEREALAERLEHLERRLGDDQV